MKKILFILCCLAFSVSVIAGDAKKVPSKFDVVVSFGSMASGPVSDSFLKSFVKKFSKKYGTKIIGYKAGSCGREGEFKILFSLSALRSSIKKRFLSEINTCVNSQEKKNRARDVHSGNISLDYNQSKDDVSYCREGIKIWK